MIKTKELYGDFANFSKVFALHHVIRYAQNPVRCVIGTAPSLNVMRMAYGETLTRAWIGGILNFLNEFAGPKGERKMTPEIVKITADLIMCNFPTLKATELMLFLNNFACGRYGKFYGSVDPLVITEALSNEYIKERSVLLDKARKEQGRKECERMMNDPNLISLTEYCERKTLNKEQATFLTKFIANDDLERRAIARSHKRFKRDQEKQTPNNDKNKAL